jgi:hypothetical protein
MRRLAPGRSGQSCVARTGRPVPFHMTAYVGFRRPSVFRDLSQILYREMAIVPTPRGSARPDDLTGLLDKCSYRRSICGLSMAF